MTERLIDPTAFIHDRALVDDGARVGARTRVWAFAHLAAGAAVGDDCNVCDHTFIEGRVVVGDRVTIKCGVHLWDGVIVEDGVFIGPSAVFTNDRTPRSQQRPAFYPELRLREGCSIGANATILPGLTIGKYAMVGAASLVTRRVPDYTIVAGSPAQAIGYVCVCGQRLPEDPSGNVVCPSCGAAYSVTDNLGSQSCVPRSDR